MSLAAQAAEDEAPTAILQFVTPAVVASITSIGRYLPRPKRALFEAGPHLAMRPGPRWMTLLLAGCLSPRPSGRRRIEATEISGEEPRGTMGARGNRSSSATSGWLRPFPLLIDR